MRLRITGLITAAVMCVAPAVGWADLAPYSQDFESMILADTGALSSDGWWVYGNVYAPDWSYIYGYGPEPAPNEPPPHFCALVAGEGGDTQGAQQLSVFSDYENGNHAVGNWIEANVFQERTVGAADVGYTWYFEFDAKMGNLELQSTAAAFIKTLDPANSYALTNFLTADMTSIPDTWDRYSISVEITGDLVGQILQFGFLNLATNYEGSGIFYDNVEFTLTSSVDVPLAGMASAAIQLSTRGNPAAAMQSQVLAFSTPRDGHVSVRVYDVSGALVATLVDGEMAAGTHEVAWNGRDAGGRSVAAGLYLAQVTAGTERAVTKLSRLR